MDKISQVHYRVPLDDKRIVDTYARTHHVTDSKLLRKAYERMAMDMKADLLSEKLGKQLAKEPVNKKVKTDEDFEKWLFKK